MQGWHHWSIIGAPLVHHWCIGASLVQVAGAELASLVHWCIIGAGGRCRAGIIGALVHHWCRWQVQSWHH